MIAHEHPPDDDWGEGTEDPDKPHSPRGLNEIEVDLLSDGSDSCDDMPNLNEASHSSTSSEQGLDSYNDYFAKNACDSNRRTLQPRSANRNAKLSTATFDGAETKAGPRCCWSQCQSTATD